MSKRVGILFIVIIGLVSAMLPISTATFSPVYAAISLTPIEQLGKSLFFDANLSKNRNQSCATCHDPATGYTGPVSSVNAHGGVYAGSDTTLFGNRKPPTAAYAGDSGLLHQDALAWSGGMFWDGRATGAVLGDPLAEQAKGPFLNPLEQALSSATELRDRVKASSYVNLFNQVFGAGAIDDDANVVYDNIGRAVAAYERSWEISAYTSKFDKFWDAAKAKNKNVASINVSNWTNYRKLGFTDSELYGLALFNSPSRANCASCHTLTPGSKGYPVFTDFGYDNIGMPKNPENPFYANLAYNPAGADWIDLGIGGYLNAAAQNGKMKVPTLRNVDKRPSTTFVKAYGHNGALKSLNDVVSFYRMRAMGGMMGGGGTGGMGGMGGGGMGGGVGSMMFGPPEVNQNLAALNGFSGMDQSYLVAFLKTLSDGYFRR